MHTDIIIRTVRRIGKGQGELHVANPADIVIGQNQRLQFVRNFPFLLLISKICLGTVGVFILTKPECHFIAVGKVLVENRFLDIFIRRGMEGHGGSKQLAVTDIHVKRAPRQIGLFHKFYRHRHRIPTVSIGQGCVNQLLAADDWLLQNKIKRTTRIIGHVDCQRNVITGGNDFFVKVQRKINTVPHQLDKTVFQSQSAIIK